MRPTWAEIDLDAIGHNTEALARASGTRLCSIVKADAYGHGAVPASRATLDAGAEMLGVALIDEGIRLRQAGIRAPILLLSEPRPSEMIQACEYDLDPTVYSGEGVAAASAAAGQQGRSIGVHLKVDTGMRRVGTEVELAPAVAESIQNREHIELASVWTHCAVADWPDDPLTDTQIERFDAALAEIEARGVEVRRAHIGNSAVALAHPTGRRDMVRSGIALYGIEPDEGLSGEVELKPAMRLVSEVSFVKRVPAGTSVSYGQAWTSDRDTTLATVPIGYADGVRRSSGQLGVEVLLGAKRCPIVGNVTMDQLLIDCGPESDVVAGQEVVLLGSQGDEEITANEVAARLGTIGYEVVCDVGPRVRRRYR